MNSKIPKSEIFRKSVHMLGLLWIPFVTIDRNLAILALVVAMLFYLSSHPIFKVRFEVPLIGRLIKGCKRGNKDGFDWGPITLASGIAISIALFPIGIAKFGIIQVALSDALAAIIGHYGTHPLPHSKGKTWEGSFIFFITAFGASIAWVSWPVALLLAFAGTLLETLPGRNIDNLTVPLGVNLLAYLLLN